MKYQFMVDEIVIHECDSYNEALIYEAGYIEALRKCIDLDLINDEIKFMQLIRTKIKEVEE